MIAKKWAAGFGIGCGIVAGMAAARAGDPPKPAAEPAGYKTVREAVTRAITPARGNQAGQTGFLGVALTRDGQNRLVVEEVQPGSPAAGAGVKRGDVLARVDGAPPRSPEAARESFQMRGPGTAVKLDLLRDGQPVAVEVLLGSTSRPRSVSARRPSYLGLGFGDVPEGEGIKVERVEPDSPAAVAGFKPGDRLFQVEGVDLPGLGRLNDILTEKRPGDEFEITVRRDGAEVVLRPKLAAEPGGALGSAANAARNAARGNGPIALPLWTKPEFRLAVIGIDYPDVKHDPKRTVADWEQALLVEGGASAAPREKVATREDKEKDDQDDKVKAKEPAASPAEPPPPSLADYLVEQSAGRFHLTGKVFEWVEVGKKRNDYVLGSGTTNITAVCVEAMEKLTARDGKDALNDFDGVLFLYAGDLVRGNRGGVYYPHAGAIRNFGGKRWPYVILPEGGSRPTPLGGMVKEFALMLGLPDLAARPEDRGSEGLGAWSVLSNPARGAAPGHLDPWAKEKLGWLSPVVIDPTVPQKLILAPVENSPTECVKVLVRPDGSEYLLLENRRKLGSDKNLPGEGLLIWRVARDRPVLEESHGVEGPPGPTAHPEEVPYPSPANHAYTPDTTPSSRSPLGGGLPVAITNIRRRDDGRISFEIGRDYR